MDILCLKRWLLNLFLHKLRVLWDRLLLGGLNGNKTGPYFSGKDIIFLRAYIQKGEV